MFRVGDTVGDYEIVARLKAGGMATLFLGKRCGASGFSRHLAIKVVHEHLASDETFVRMFVDEALLSSKIQHPNVVHVEELREVDGRHYLVMEYVHGCSLAVLIRGLRRSKRAFNADLATYIAAKVAGGLHAAHEATGSRGEPLSVVHRDVSPQNVLLSYKGHVKLIDFGVAKAAGRATQTTGGSLKGKIRYMSPEQAFGRPVDRRTDVYALGIVLWEMLTGRHAFRGDNEFALLEIVRHPEVPPARTFNPNVPEALDAVIQKALEVDVEDRFQSCQEMRKALSRACPTALELDESDLARLLATVLGDSIQKSIAALPESVSGIVAPLPADDDALQTMTVSAAGILSEPSEVRPGTPAPTSVSDVLPPAVIVEEMQPDDALTVATPSHLAPDGEAASDPSSSPRVGESTMVAMAPPRSRTLLFAGVGAVALSLGAGLAMLLVWGLGSEEGTSGIEVVQLSSAAHTAEPDAQAGTDAGAENEAEDSGVDAGVDSGVDAGAARLVESGHPPRGRRGTRRSAAGSRSSGRRRGRSSGRGTTGGRGGDSRSGVLLTDDF